MANEKKDEFITTEIFGAFDNSEEEAPLRTGWSLSNNNGFMINVRRKNKDEKGWTNIGVVWMHLKNLSALRQYLSLFKEKVEGAKDGESISSVFDGTKASITFTAKMKGDVPYIIFKITDLDGKKDEIVFKFPTLYPSVDVNAISKLEEIIFAIEGVLAKGPVFMSHIYKVTGDGSKRGSKKKEEYPDDDEFPF